MRWLTLARRKKKEDRLRRPSSYRLVCKVQTPPKTSNTEEGGVGEKEESGTLADTHCGQFSDGFVIRSQGSQSNLMGKISKVRILRNFKSSSRNKGSKLVLSYREHGGMPKQFMYNVWLRSVERHAVVADVLLRGA